MKTHKSGEFAARLVEIFDLPAQSVSFQLNVVGHDFVTATVEFIPCGEALDELSTVLDEYVLVKKEGAEDE